MTATLRPMSSDDWTHVARIYAAGIATGNATFEGTVPTTEDWDDAHLSQCRWVAEADHVVGWAALSPVSGRCVYAGVAEVSVYVDPAASGAGIGTDLLRRLVDSSEEIGIWTLQAGVFRENVASIRLHEKCGFRVIGHQERLGRMPDGTWRDVVLLERRSKKVG